MQYLRGNGASSLLRPAGVKEQKSPLNFTLPVILKKMIKYYRHFPFIRRSYEQIQLFLQQNFFCEIYVSSSSL